ncbi:MAG: phosphoenolpyruvate hydrolase family protein [Bacillota bacterium]|nr:phosphoenolpyruvate hydrolase family protein [Bacillota bacterium]
MAKSYSRLEVIARLRLEVRDRKPIISAIVGNGIVAKMCEIGQADLLVTYILARYRMAGHSSLAGYLPIGDNNALVMELGEREIMPAVKEIPVIAGLLGCDVTRDLSTLINRVKAIGFSGIHNAPTISCIDGTFRQALEETGITFDREVEMIHLAHEEDMFTQVFVSNPEEAKKMAAAGADLVIAHLGNTLGGSIGSETVFSFSESASRVQEIIDTARAVNPEIFTMCHGGSIVDPADFASILEQTRGLDGYIGGSSIERIPVEKAILKTVKDYKQINIP